MKTERGILTVEVFVGANGLWYWHEKAGNGELIASGEGYATKRALLDTLNLRVACYRENCFRIVHKD